MNYNMIFLFLSLVTLFGCGTLTHGPKQSIPLSSTPQGAAILVNGKATGAITPAVITLPRAKEHEITVVQENGASRTIRLKRKINQAVLATLLPGGMLFLGIDSLNGSLYTLNPQEIRIIFEQSCQGDLILATYFCK